MYAWNTILCSDFQLTLKYSDILSWNTLILISHQSICWQLDWVGCRFLSPHHNTCLVLEVHHGYSPPVSIPNGSKMRNMFSEFSSFPLCGPVLHCLCCLLLLLIYICFQRPHLGLCYSVLENAYCSYYCCQTAPLVSPFEVYQNQESDGFTVLTYFLQSRFCIFIM